VLGLLALFVVFFVLRPLVGRVLAPEAGTAASSSTAVLPAGAAPALAPSADAAIEAAAAQSETAMMIDIAQVKGQVHAQSVQKVGELAERNPHETVAIIRHWMHESPA